MQKYAMRGISDIRSIGNMHLARWRRGKNKVPRERWQFYGEPPPLYACLPDRPHRANELRIRVESIQIGRWHAFKGLPKSDPETRRWRSPRTRGIAAIKRRKICTTGFTYLPQLYGRPDDSTHPYLILLEEL